jgi:peptide chain release factor subunit 1
VRKCAEHAVTFFITDNKCNVTGLVLGGSADFKTELLQSDLFDPRLQKAVIKTVDVSYGMDPGFNQAIELAGECLANVKLVQEKKLLQKYFDEISQDTGKYCFMVQDTLQALEMSSVETIIVWENLTINRLTVKNTNTGEEKILHLDPEQEKNDALFHDPVTGVQLEIIERLTLVSTCTGTYYVHVSALCGV